MYDVWRLMFGRYAEGAENPGYVATVAYADGTSPPPEPWQRVLHVGSEYQVYGGVPPVAPPA